MPVVSQQIVDGEIKVVTWNATSITSVDKQQELRLYIRRNKPDIILLTETWLTEEQNLNYDNYLCYRKNRTKKRGGGVAVLVRKLLAHQAVESIETRVIENVGIGLTTSTGQIDIFACYFPGGNSTSDGSKQEDFAGDIEKLCRNYYPGGTDARQYILGGDLNCKNQSWGCTDPNCWGSILNNKMARGDIHMKFPSEPTFRKDANDTTGSIIDGYLTNAPSFLSHPVVVQNQLESSRHLPVEVTLEIGKRFTRDVRVVDWENFLKQLPDALDEKLFAVTALPDEIDEMINAFNNAINTSLANNVRQETRVIAEDETKFRNKNWNISLRSLKGNSYTGRYISKLLSLDIVEVIAETETLGYKGQLEVIEENSASNSEPSIDHNDDFVTVKRIGQILDFIKIKDANNVYIKNLPIVAIRVLTIIINSLLKACYFPNLRKETNAECAPNQTTPAAPISILPALRTILEVILNEKLKPVTVTLSRRRNGTAAESNPLKIIKDNMTTKTLTGMVVLDIKSVWRRALNEKMNQLDFPKALTHIIRTVLTDNFELPPSSRLSDTLFTILMYDIPRHPEIYRTFISPHNITILSSSEMANDMTTNLESALTDVEAYFSKWNISLNVATTQAIFFTNKRKPCFIPAKSLQCGNTKISWLEKLIYKNIVLDTKLNFNDHVEYVVLKFQNTFELLEPLLNGKSQLSFENKQIVIEKVFLPMLLYTAPVWEKFKAKCNNEKLRVQFDKLLKMVNNLPDNFSPSRSRSDHIDFVFESTTLLEYMDLFVR